MEALQLKVCLCCQLQSFTLSLMHAYFLHTRYTWTPTENFVEGQALKTIEEPKVLSEAKALERREVRDLSRDAVAPPSMGVWKLRLQKMFKFER